MLKYFDYTVERLKFTYEIVFDVAVFIFVRKSFFYMLT